MPPYRHLRMEVAENRPITDGDDRFAQVAGVGGGAYLRGTRSLRANGAVPDRCGFDEWGNLA